MDLAHIPVRALWLCVAAACVVGGAPMFAAGRRALRLRRVLAGLAERPLGSDLAGVSLVRGRVSLEGPLFAPLSGKPCAGYTLDVTAEGLRVGGSLADLRPFRLTSDGVTARVVPEGARWNGPVTSERRIAPGEELPQRLAELITSHADARWMRDRAVPLRLVERALEVGAQVYVTGSAHGAATAVAVDTLELAATGTDDAVGMSLGSAATDFHPGLWIEPSEVFEQVLVTAEPPAAGTLVPPAWRLAFLVLGPLTTMLGFLYILKAAAVLVRGRV
jgi:hypothetical protein